MSAPYGGESSALWEPGTTRVAPLASVKSVRAHMVLQTIGAWGLASGISVSSAWMGWARLAGPDADRRQGREQAAGVEHVLDDREDGRVHRNGLEVRPVDQQVVDPDGGAALEGVVGRRDAQLVLEPLEVVVQGGDEVGAERVGHDRVAVALERVALGGGGKGRLVPQRSWSVPLTVVTAWPPMVTWSS